MLVHATLGFALLLWSFQEDVFAENTPVAVMTLGFQAIFLTFLMSSQENTSEMELKPSQKRQEDVVGLRIWCYIFTPPVS